MGIRTIRHPRRHRDRYSGALAHGTNLATPKNPPRGRAETFGRVATLFGHAGHASKSRAEPGGCPWRLRGFRPRPWFGCSHPLLGFWLGGVESFERGRQIGGRVVDAVDGVGGGVVARV